MLLVFGRGSGGMIEVGAGSIYPILLFLSSDRWVCLFVGIWRSAALNVVVSAMLLVRWLNRAGCSVSRAHALVVAVFVSSACSLTWMVSLALDLYERIG